MSEELVARIARPSVASLHLTATVNGLPLSNATGFVVRVDDVPYLITNWHVVSGRNPQTGEVLSKTTGATPDALLIQHNVPGALGHWVAISEPLRDNEGPRWLEYPTHGRAIDVAALRLSTAGVALYEHRLDNAIEWTFSIADDVNIVGFPFGRGSNRYLAIWARGTVASDPDIDFSGLPCFLVDSRTRPGQSGSPVLKYAEPGQPIRQGTRMAFLPNHSVEVLLGVYSGRINEQSDLGFVWRTEVIEQIIRGGQRGSDDESMA